MATPETYDFVGSDGVRYRFPWDDVHLAALMLEESPSAIDVVNQFEAQCGYLRHDAMRLVIAANRFRRTR